MFGFGKKDKQGNQVRLEHRGKHIRLSRTGGAALRTEGKVLGVNTTLNTSHGVRISSRIAKGARVALQNGKFRLIGRWNSGPLSFNLSKSGVSASVKTDAGAINFVKPRYSSYKAAGIQIRGKNAMYAHMAHFAFQSIISLGMVLVAAGGIILWTIAFLCLFIWDFFAGIIRKDDEEAAVVDASEVASAPASSKS